MVSYYLRLGEARCVVNFYFEYIAELYPCNISMVIKLFLR